jgi:hypothetical protein
MSAMRCLVALFIITTAQNLMAFEPLGHPIRSLKFWGDIKKVDLVDKIVSKAPPELIDYLRKDNEKNGWSNIPQAVEVPNNFVMDLRSALEEIPKNIRLKISDKLIGIFMVSDLGGSAFTDYVLNESGQPVAGLVVVDISALNKTANKWASWKESSPFRPSDGTTIDVTIAEPSYDNRKNALQYILLHEFGHVLSIGGPLVPRWGVRADKLNNLEKMRFFKLSWRLKDFKFASVFDDSWADRSKINFYVPPEKQIAGTIALSGYRHLLATNYPTLYSVTNPFDDFAESFANYVHVVRLNKPWHISAALKSDRVNIGACWEEIRCREKKRIIEELLQ